MAAQYLVPFSKQSVSCSQALINAVDRYSVTPGYIRTTDQLPLCLHLYYTCYYCLIPVLLFPPICVCNEFHERVIGLGGQFNNSLSNVSSLVSLYAILFLDKQIDDDDDDDDV